MIDEIKNLVKFFPIYEILTKCKSELQKLQLLFFISIEDIRIEFRNYISIKLL